MLVDPDKNLLTEYIQMKWRLLHFLMQSSKKILFIFWSDLERVRNGIGCKLSLVIQYLSTFVSGIIIGFIVNWRLTLVIVLIGPVLIAISSYIAKVRGI